MNINEILKKIISSELNLGKELELDNYILNENKLLYLLFEESLIGTPEENYTGKDPFPPSEYVAISFILTIESEFNIDFGDIETADLIGNGRIIDLINSIKNKRSQVDDARLT